MSTLPSKPNLGGAVKANAPAKAPDLNQGLLSSVIRTLSASSSPQQRENEKIKLDKAFRECDQKLDGLLNQHHQQLSTLIVAFSSISDKLADSRVRIAKIKENLRSCKSLLHCKRDELRKFWIDGLEQSTIVSMLESIEVVRDAPEKLQSYLDKKYYLHATELVCNALSLLRHDLKDVEAMVNIAADMEKCREVLVAKLLDELSIQLYSVSVKNTVMVFRRVGSLHASGGVGLRGSTVAAADMAAEQQVVEELSGDPESKPAHFLAVLIECLAMLREVPAAIAAIRQRMPSELADVVRRASQQFVDTAFNQGEINLSTQEQPAYLLELLHLLFEQFRCITHAHNVVIKHLKRVKNSASNPYKGMALYDITEVWSKIQTVLQLTLKEYITDVRSSVEAPKLTPVKLDPDIPEKPQRVDFASYFLKRKTRAKREPLFQFSNSSYALRLTEYLRDQRNESYVTGDLAAGDLMPLDYTPFGGSSIKGKLMLVCKPAVSNITAVYKMVESFSSEIEMTMGYESSGSCSLHRFVTDFVGNTFVKHIHDRISCLITEETSSFDSHKRVVEPRRRREQPREAIVERPLLHSTVVMMECVNELCGLMQDLPDYSHKFISMLVNIIKQYSESCQANYQGIVKTSEGDSRSISAAWAKDEDISRFLRSLPNWHSLHHERSAVDGSGEAVPAVATISDDEMRALNYKESSILTSNLTSQDAIIPAGEIISDPVMLKLLGSMHVSLEWLVQQLKTFVQALPDSSSSLAKNKEKLDIPEVEHSTVMGLDQLSDGLLELSDVCLLVLHLEVRVHCFYYLMPVAKQSNYYCAIDDMDADSNVVNLNRDLTSIEEAMSQSVQPNKFRYIFDGLGHLVSSLLINSVQYLKRINENGVKKMCRNIFAIQQSLTNVTSSRESDLDHARRYYELLNLTIDENLNLILEQGAKYSELEYVNLFNLIKRSKPSMDNDHYKEKLQKLKDVISEKHIYNV